MTKNRFEITHLVNTIKELRGKDGCPWDKKQTPSSLIRYLNEEVGELVQAIDISDIPNICEEIGDILYILVMIAEMHSERGQFDFHDVVESINSKLIRRHPHVFEGKKILNEEDLRLQWEKIKMQEKKNN